VNTNVFLFNYAMVFLISNTEMKSCQLQMTNDVYQKWQDDVNKNLK